MTVNFIWHLGFDIWHSPVYSKSHISSYKEMTMDNIQIEVKDNKAVITIDLIKDFGPSKSGKTVVVATTRGNVPIPGAENIRLGINCYKYQE
jgi:hypothetical protein